MTKKKHSEYSFKSSQIAAFRLARHHLRDHYRADLTTVCRHVCGIQAQVMSAAQMALWARMHGLTQAEIHSALWEDRTLVKTSLMRQTLHLIPADDFSIYISALRRSRMEALMRVMSRFGITRKEVDALNEAVVEALRSSPMTHHQLTEQIKPKASKNVRAWMERVWSAFKPALAEGLICYGRNQGQEVAFIRIDQWIPKQREVPEMEAKQLLLRRYLSAYGPATLKDFSKWTGISMKEAKPVWDSMEEELIEVSVEERRGSMLCKDYQGSVPAL